MALHRYEQSDFGWTVTHPLPNKPHGVALAGRAPVTTR